jgi:hypothetical protein
MTAAALARAEGRASPSRYPQAPDPELNEVDLNGMD